MTLQRATQYALTGMWLYLLVSIIQTVLAMWYPNLYYGNPTVLKSLWILSDIVGTIPLIIFFATLSKTQRGSSNS